jgi:CheY-like chemotaxis protein
MKSPELPSVLCVDDEPRILEGLAVQLRRKYQVSTAGGGQAALKMLQDMPPPAVVISDMRMPGMDGAALLKQVKALVPETVRILLTGETGRDAAIEAVNEGQIFRFLTKPCTPDALHAAIASGVEQHRLMVAEKVLLQETLIGCIKALIDVLAITNPVAFGRTNRVKRMAMAVSEAMGRHGFWQLEAAAMLSQIGYISLPTELVEKLFYGERLTVEERILADGAPKVAQKLLGRIPRLEAVMQILEPRGSKVPEVPGALSLGANILHLVLDYDRMIVQGNSPQRAVQELRGRSEPFDKELIDALAALVGAAAREQQIIEMAVAQVSPGMIILDDLRTHIGTLLVPKGFEVTEAFLERRRHFGPGILQERVRVMVMVAAPAAMVEPAPRATAL